MYLKETDVKVRTALMWLWIGLVASSCEQGNEPSNSIKGGEILDQLSDYQLLKDSAP
jgi:hypothetical protein